MEKSQEKSEIGARIKALRKRFGLTAMELSEMINVSTEYLSLVERGDRNFSTKNLIKLSRLLNASLDYIILGRSADDGIESFETGLLHALPPTGQAFVMNLCKTLTVQKYSEAELNYLESLIKCYFTFKTKSDESGKKSHHNESNTR